MASRKRKADRTLKPLDISTLSIRCQLLPKELYIFDDMNHYDGETNSLLSTVPLIIGLILYIEENL